MEVIDSKRKRRRQFIFLYVVTVALVALSFLAFLVPNAPSQNATTLTTDKHQKLLDLYDRLHKNWLYFLNYKEMNSSSPALVETAEDRFKLFIDSVETSGRDVAVGEEKQPFQEAIASFRKTVESFDHSNLNNPESNTNSISEGAVKSEDPAKDLAIANLQQQLKADEEKVQMKDKRIRELENNLAAGTKIAIIKEPAKNNSKTEQENEFLKWAIRSQVTDLKKLTDENNNLKQANSRLSTQLVEARKNN